MKINFQNTKHIKTVGKIKDVPEFDKEEIVLAGRSNVGKSSLINALTNSKSLARVSASPGKTRLILYFDVDGKFILTDLPGYGYAKADKSTVGTFNALTDNYLQSEKRFALVLFLLDIRHKPSKQDEMMFEFLNEIEQPYVVVLTKADKLSKNQIFQQEKMFRKLSYIGEEGALFTISNTKKAGLQDLKDFIGDYLSDFE
ncbi:ribosome biogenesis GTP-binding protein YihA/YsxC [Fastidiosipila sanguinis]|uniref:Probable GTP-binding protein EngB n=1 Tax=Fastidiosipila sanguinis TaxID=236753 RepID=A0A2S0KMM5_9FIRM|nr:ribosome biogenesis GTP-binding protein YihA/YsxC [Fastidiosipila sanguinis]AVM42285.1 YihA family ribosome biogenesis GTP-binding protein [Fastidiosipila sanguinis]